MQQEYSLIFGKKGKYSVGIRRSVGEQLNSSEQRDYRASLRLYVDLLQNIL
jgi:hypothetical protein